MANSCIVTKTIFFLKPIGPDEEGYFDEIRTFMGKVTASSAAAASMSGSRAETAYSPHSDQDIDVEEDDMDISDHH